MPSQTKSPLGWHGTNVGLGDGVFVEAGGEDLEEDVTAELGEGPVLWRRDLFIIVLHNSGRERQKKGSKWTGGKPAAGENNNAAQPEEDGPLARLSMRPCPG